MSNDIRKGCCFENDPRIYEITVKEFVTDKDGNVVKAKFIKLDWEKDPKTGRMNMFEIEGSGYRTDGIFEFVRTFYC